ncbi:hypothetical protein D3C77_97540 [compost metagenome]
MLVQRHQEHLVRLQVTNDLGAVMAFAQGITQLAAEALLAGGVVQKALDFGWQDVDHLFEQVVANQSFTAMQCLGQCAVGPRFAGRQLPEAQAGHPAIAALDQVVQRLAAQGRGLLTEHRQRLVRGQAQVLFVELQQLARQAQAGQVPVRALAAGDQQHQARRQVIEKKLQAAIKHRALGQVIVVQYQQQGIVRLQVAGQFVEQAVEPLLEGEGLVALAHLEQAQGLIAHRRAILLKAFEQPFEETPRIAVTPAQAQPQAAPVVGQALAELHRQRALAETGRRIDQQQPPAQPGLQTLAQSRPRHMPVRQWRAIETPFQGTHGLAGEPLRTGQISHRRLVLVRESSAVRVRAD